MKKPPPEPAALPFRREKLLALGTLALLAPVPLAFSYVLEPVALAGYLLVLGLFLAGVVRGRILCLGSLALNLAGFAYFVAFWFDLRHGSRTLLKTTLHLLLFTMLFKLASIRRERDFSVALALVGFLFLASVATSFHYAILLFVLVFALVAWPVLVRWALFRDLAAVPEEWRRDPAARKLPGAKAALWSVAAAFVLAIPFFITLPRLKTPLVRGIEGGREISTGFSETVDPDLYGFLKENDSVYLRLTTGEPLAIPEDGRLVLRLRTLAFTRYEGRTWRKTEKGGRPEAATHGSIVPLVAPARVQVPKRKRMSLDLTPLGSRFVPYPEGGVALRFSEASLRAAGSWFVEKDDARNVRLPSEPQQSIHYDAFYGGPPTPDLTPPLADDASRRGIASERVRDFVRSVSQGIDPGEDPERVAARVEAYLSTRFTYTLQLMRSGPNPVEEFLFSRQAGHCESFATAMAVALRDVGIPTRFVTGFAGGEMGLFGQYVIVRGRNAHAWVEAWCGPGKGWLTFDPTPPSGRPIFERVPWTKRFRQVADGAEFFYDRYILSFGQGDQMELVRAVRDAVGTVAEKTGGAAEAAKKLFDKGTWRGPAGAAAGALLFAFLFWTFLARGRPGRGPAFLGRGLPPATAAYRRLQRVLRRRGAPLTPASAPGETLKAASTFGPPVAAPAREIVLAYVAESFGGLSPGEEEAKRLAGLLKSLRAALKKKAA